jgi:hypothetical protein
MRNALVIAQVAASFVLLIGAGLMARSLLKLQGVNPGFDPERVLVMRVTANWSKYNSTEEYRDLGLRLVEQVQTQVGVLSAALASNYPLNPLGLANNNPTNQNIQIEGRVLGANEPLPRVDLRIVSTDYFKTLRLPLLSGRMFAETDTAQAQPIAVINQTLARHRWGNEDPLGKRLSVDQGESWITIVGVVGDVHQYGLNREPTDELYRPIRQTFGASNLLVRTMFSPTMIMPQLRKAIYAVDPDYAIDQVQTLETVRQESMASPRLTTVLLGLFATLGAAHHGGWTGGSNGFVRQPAHARDRHPHGAGRIGEQRVANGVATGDDACADRFGAGHRRRAVVDALDGDAAVRGRADRSADVSGCLRRVGIGGGHRVFCARAPGDDD